MMSSKCSCKDWGLLLIRLALAVVFIVHGGQKLGNMTMVTGFFATLGLPTFLAWAVAIGEVVAGVAMLIGKWTKFAGYLIAIIMLGAIWTAKWKMGFVGGWEYDFVLLLAGVSVALTGPGSMAVCGGGCPCGADACKGGCKMGDSCCKH